jgi:hypothetical protein
LQHLDFHGVTDYAGGMGFQVDANWGAQRGTGLAGKAAVMLGAFDLIAPHQPVGHRPFVALNAPAGSREMAHFAPE